MKTLSILFSGLLFSSTASATVEDVSEAYVDIPYVFTGWVRVPACWPTGDELDPWNAEHPMTGETKSVTNCRWTNMEFPPEPPQPVCEPHVYDCRALDAACPEENIFTCSDDAWTCEEDPYAS